MKVFFWCFLLGVMHVTGGNAQKMLDLEDVISGGKNFRNYIPENRLYEFLPKTDSLLLYKTDGIYYVDDKLVESPFIKKEKINKILEINNIDSIKSLRNVKLIDSNLLWIKNPAEVVVMDVRQEKVTGVIKLPGGIKFLSFNEISKKVVYSKGGDLYVLGLNGMPLLIEKADKPGIVLGETVHRNEFGIDKGIFWAPNGESVAFYRKDESMVSDYPLVDVSARVAELEEIKYPMAGMKSHHVTVGVFNIVTGERVYLKTGEPDDKYLTNLSWTPDAKYIAVAELNRAQDHMQYKLYNSASGDLQRTLFEERSATWVEPENPAEFLPGSNSKFLWQSERSGYNHLYLYDLKKGLLRQITAGNWVVTKLLGFDKKGSCAFVEATKEGVMERHLYNVSLKTGKMHKISEEPGMHSFVLSENGNKLVDNFSSLKVPRIIKLHNLNEQSSEELFKAKNPFENIDYGEIKLGTLKSADGITDLNYRLILPQGFDKNKKYPVVVYVYGGPHAQLVQNSWMGAARYWQIYMAQKGYICFTMDNRGTPNRGCEFEKVIHRHLGECEAADQMEGVRFLKSLPYVDESRIGVHGWSFGGFMTINLMEKYPDIFKVGVSGGPVIDWKYYEIMYGERYMDLPQENLEGYNNSNLNLRVGNLEGRLLVIHGAIDPTVVWQHSLTFIEQCIKMRKQVDYFVYPKHEHNVRGVDRVHLMEKVTRYFEDFL
ncbi:S9 family peptidase [Plebeiibacterium marinum]|uniref:S9 family peptidase n=1 Tax=Plebeiibacterium marinum TaxID=2992111 RepID=A0AAE3MEB8_9BACT|nr:DPP IV N-terminal domain-containing protein [Plebeiobacterium marinum]MCW3806248.1 S9 family peptidase [Plebeiobacterium marinum]